MDTVIVNDRAAMGRYVAQRAADDLRTAIESQKFANLVIATGSSQFEVLEELVSQDGIDWSRVTGFHLDEYVGIGHDHAASFVGYLKERFVDRVNLGQFHFLNGKQDAEQTIAEIGALLLEHPIDVMLCGIGENGHLAFNDPPANFETSDPYLIVELDEPCRLQQVGEGWFKSLADVPTHAISMSIRQIMSSKKIYCSVPDDRKAEAVRATLEDSISPQIPASILREHDAAMLIIDEAAAGRLSPEMRAKTLQA